MRVVFLSGAEADLQGTRRYVLKNFGARTWQDTKAKLKDSVAVIRAFPLAGAIPDELADLGSDAYLQVISGMNRIIYEVAAEVIYIHIVCDTRRDMRTLLTRRLLRAAE